MITINDAHKIRMFIIDLQDIECCKNNVPDQFLADQDDEVREAAWAAALAMAESIIRSRLRTVGVDA